MTAIINETTGGVRARNANDRSFAEQRLHEYIQHGAPLAQQTIEHVMREVPQDQIVRANVLDFEAGADGIHYWPGDRANARLLHRNAVGQMAGRAGVPLRYVDQLAEGEPWQKDLLAHTLREHFQHDNARYLTRTVGDETRAFLSDRYRRIDCRPVLEALIGAAQKADAIIVNGIHSPVRNSLKVVIPEIFEPVPGEYVMWGLNWTNSDFGRGANELGIFALRLVCWNGMVGERAVRQIHLGRKLDESIEYSDRTFKLDTAASVSAVRDVAGHFLNRDRIMGHLSAVESAANTEVNGKAAAATLAKVTTKATAQAVTDAFNSPDVVDLPAGNNEWRWSNAISLVARDETDPDKKIDLERLAGDILTRHGLGKK